MRRGGPAPKPPRGGRRKPDTIYQDEEDLGMRTFAIYQDTTQGRVRWGVFTCRGTSVREVSRQFTTMYRDAARQGALYVADRRSISERWVDVVSQQMAVQ